MELKWAERDAAGSDAETCNVLGPWAPGTRMEPLTWTGTGSQAGCAPAVWLASSGKGRCRKHNNYPPELGGKGDRSSCVMGTEFQVGKVRRFWRWVGEGYPNKVGLILQTACLNMARRANFVLCIFYHHKKMNSSTQKNLSPFICLLLRLYIFKLWLGRSVGWSTILLCQGCGFDPRSGHMQESTNECINKWNNILISLSPCRKQNIKSNKLIH